jgi:glutamyl-tRNA synthetase
MATWNDLAELMFPDVKETIADLQAKFPERQGVCTRFAPSPTGYLHI